MEMHREVATLAGGCFWCLEAVFEEVRGMEQVRSGYIGGHVPDPSYEAVCTGATGHAEAVQVTYDPSVLSFQEVLGLFFASHDPTTLNRQGPDVGTQYRSAIFFDTPEQGVVAREVMAELSAAGVWDRPIVTELVPLAAFYPAEEHHREYYRRNREAPYCQVLIAPKLAAFRTKHAGMLKPTTARLR